MVWDKKASSQLASRRFAFHNRQCAYTYYHYYSNVWSHIWTQDESKLQADILRKVCRGDFWARQLIAKYVGTYVVLSPFHHNMHIKPD